jgi:RHS repeat-associated protein
MSQNPRVTIKPHDQRVAKLINGEVVEKYLWANLTTLLAIYNPDDSLKQRFEYATQRMPISMSMGNDKYYLHYDQIGSLRAISDNSHHIIKEITYDSFGNILTDSNPTFTIPFGFAGGLYDADTKLTRFGYRDYDAFVGKWTAKDPIGFDGGDSNLYGYVLGDGVNFVDPSGLIPPLAIAIAGGTTGAGMSFYDSNKGEVKFPKLDEFIINVCLGALGGYGAGVGVASKIYGSTTAGIIGDVFINIGNYANSD